MIPQGLFTQIALIILSVGILFTYVHPKFEEISANQDSIAAYREEQQKVSAVNATLSALSAKANSLSPDDQSRLDTYLPNSVDGIAVQRDLLFIAEEAEIELTSLAYASDSTASGAGQRGGRNNAATLTPIERGARSELVPHSFTLGFAADYETIKTFLDLLTTNNYPLEVVSLGLGSAEAASGVGGPTASPQASDALTAELTLVTYALRVIEE